MSLTDVRGKTFSCKRYLIRICGMGGELDRRDVDTEEEIGPALIDIITNAVIHPGDQFYITDTQPE